MRKMPCLFEFDSQGDNKRGVAIDKVTPGCEWVTAGEGVATRKWDGTACAVIEGRLYARLDCKRGAALPSGAIKCAPEVPEDAHGGKVYWIPVTADRPDLKWHMEAWATCKESLPDGTYELIGPRVNGNPERVLTHDFKRHGDQILDAPRGFDALKEYLSRLDAEGVVFHHPDGVRKCKLRRRDFGFKWPVPR